MRSAEARGGMATGDREVARAAQAPALRVGAVPLGFTTDAPHGRAGSFTFGEIKAT